MELIVVIVILAILAAILIPGLLKWIDQAKDKKYELEARGIAQAAEAALTKMYAQGTGVLVSGGLLAVDGNTDLAGVSAFQDELAKFTDAEVTGISIYGSSTDGTGSWGGSVSGFEIDFEASDGAEIVAKLLPNTNRWTINGSSGGTGGESSDELDAFDNDPNPNVREANAIAKAAKKALAKVYADDSVYVSEIYWGALEYSTSEVSYERNFMKLPTFANEIAKLTDINVENIKYIVLYGTGFNTDDDNYRSWEGSVTAYYIWFVSGEDNIYAYNQSGLTNTSFGSNYDSPASDGWVIEKKDGGWPFE